MQGMIRRLRKKRGLSQAQLAEKMGKARSTVAMWELGTNGITVPMLYALARALDVPITSFFEDEPPQGGNAPNNTCPHEERPHA